jgi:hypothetical protein
MMRSSWTATRMEPMPELAPESMLDEDDSTPGVSRMDTDNHQEFPTPTEAYLKKPPISDADAVKKAKKGGRKK